MYVKHSYLKLTTLQNYSLIEKKVFYLLVLTDPYLAAYLTQLTGSGSYGEINANHRYSTFDNVKFPYKHFYTPFMTMTVNFKQ